MLEDFGGFRKNSGKTTMIMTADKKTFLPFHGHYRNLRVYHVTEALSFNNALLIPCRQFRTALLRRYTSPHYDVLILIPLWQLPLQTPPRLNLLHHKRHINVWILPSRQQQFSRIVIDVFMYEITKFRSPIHRQHKFRLAKLHIYSQTSNFLPHTSLFNLHHCHR